MLNNFSQLLGDLPKYFGLNEISEVAVDSLAAAEKLIQQSTGGAASLADYLSYRYFDEDSQIFVGDGNYLGFILEIAPIVGVDEGMLKNLRFFFNDEMPEGCFLQFLLVGSHDVESVLEKWQVLRTNKHPILEKLTKNRADFIRQMAVNFEGFDGRIARDYRIYISFNQKLKASPKNISKVQLFKERLIKKLGTLNLHSRICGADDLISLVRDLVQMELSPGSKKPRYDKLNLISNQILKPLQKQVIEDDQINHESTGLISKCFYAKELPVEFSLANMIGLLGSSENNTLGIPARFVINYTVARDLNRSQQLALNAKGDRAIHAAEQFYSRNNLDLKREALEWKEINDSCKNGEQILTESFSVMITAPKSGIDLAEQALVSLYNILDFRLEISSTLQAISLLSLLPMQQGIYWNILKYYKLTRGCQSKEVIARLPIHAEWKGVPQSGVLLHARRGQLFNFNLFYRISSGNYNMTVFGPSGGGKSVFLQELVVSMLAQNTRCFVLDIGQSFANICKLLDGEIIQFGKKAGLSLNPFASFAPDMSAEDRTEFLVCAKALLSIMCSIADDDGHGSAELEKAICGALLESNYQLDITGFAKYLEASESSVQRKFGTTLYPYTKDGIYGKYFSGVSTARFNRQMTVFEFEEIKNDPKLLSIVLQILLMEVTNQFLTGDRSQAFMIIVDEAWMLLDFAASFFAAFGRTVRKYGGSLVICVQNFMDLQKTQDHRTILENSTWTAMLKQDEKGMEAFKNSEAFKDMVPLIQSISLVPGKYSEILLVSTGVKVIGRLVLDNYSKVLYSTDSSDFTYLNTATNSGMSLELAVEELALKKYGARA
jgi:conjugal transfer ATP-binding protein TraC